MGLHTHKLSQHEYFPVLGNRYRREDFVSVDLSVDNDNLSSYQVEEISGMEHFMCHFRKAHNQRIPYGGYGEKRFIYMNSPLFKESGRCIHLGIDIWMPAGTPLYSSSDARVHSFAFNNNFLDYGATIILYYEIENIYALYGHLSLDSLQGIKKGQLIEKGSPFATIGNPTENGHWFPHLHLQKILDIGDYQGDYPGVASESESSRLMENCPNPQSLIFP